MLDLGTIPPNHLTDGEIKEMAKCSAKAYFWTHVITVIILKAEHLKGCPRDFIQESVENISKNHICVGIVCRSSCVMMNSNSILLD